MMDRREAPASRLNQREEFKLNLRRRALAEVLSKKRCPYQSIKGYNLWKCWPKYYIKKKRCWECGSYSHLIAECPKYNLSRLRERVSELEQMVVQLEDVLQDQIKIKEKRDKKRKKKKKKKKIKKHQEMVGAFISAVRMKRLLYKEEEKQDYTYYSSADSYLKKKSPKNQKSIRVAYKMLFEKELSEDMLKAFYTGDCFLGKLERKDKMNEIMDVEDMDTEEYAVP